MMATERTGRPARCYCGKTKKTFGTRVDLCPDCDFANCPACKRPVRELSWTTCTHCGARPH